MSLKFLRALKGNLVRPKLFTIYHDRCELNNRSAIKCARACNFLINNLNLFRLRNRFLALSWMKYGSI